MHHPLPFDKLPELNYTIFVNLFNCWRVKDGFRKIHKTMFYNLTLDATK
jgi:hypothetical protein